MGAKSHLLLSRHRRSKSKRKRNFPCVCRNRLFLGVHTPKKETCHIMKIFSIQPSRHDMSVTKMVFVQSGDQILLATKGFEVSSISAWTGPNCCLLVSWSTSGTDDCPTVTDPIYLFQQTGPHKYRCLLLNSKRNTKWKSFEFGDLQIKHTDLHVVSIGLELTRNSDHPYSDKVGPTCSGTQTETTYR